MREIEFQTHELVGIASSFRDSEKAARLQVCKRFICEFNNRNWFNFAIDTNLQRAVRDYSANLSPVVGSNLARDMDDVENYEYTVRQRHRAIQFFNTIFYQERARALYLSDPDDESEEEEGEEGKGEGEGRGEGEKKEFDVDKIMLYLEDVIKGHELGDLSYDPDRKNINPGANPQVIYETMVKIAVKEDLELVDRVYHQAVHMNSKLVPPTYAEQDDYGFFRHFKLITDLCRKWGFKRAPSALLVSAERKKNRKRKRRLKKQRKKWPKIRKIRKKQRNK